MCSQCTQWGHLEPRTALAEAQAAGSTGSRRCPRSWAICTKYWCGHKHETIFNTQLGARKMALLLLLCLNVRAWILGYALAATCCSWGRHSAKAGVKLSLGPISSAWPISVPALDRAASRNPAFLLALALESGAGNRNLLCRRQRAGRAGSPGTAGYGCACIGR